MSLTCSFNQPEAVFKKDTIFLCLPSVDLLIIRLVKFCLLSLSKTLVPLCVFQTFNPCQGRASDCRGWRLPSVLSDYSESQSRVRRWQRDWRRAFIWRSGMRTDMWNLSVKGHITDLHNHSTTMNIWQIFTVTIY